MTSITKELREYTAAIADKGSGTFAHLEAIADAIEQELAERYVVLPLDADGMPIRVGDVMERKGNRLYDDALFEVRALRCGELGWEAIDRLGDRCDPSTLRHHQPDSWERIIADAYMRGAHEQYIEDGRVIEVSFKSDYDLVVRCKALAREGA